MSKVLYFLVTFLESFLSVFGIRAGTEEVPYRVESKIGSDIEIRRYGPRVAVETAIGGDDFQRLFDYIAGGNARKQTISMTAPVEQRGGKLAPPVAAPAAGGGPASATMRFFLPKTVAQNPPKPDDSSVHVVNLPAQTLAVIRFSGSLDRVQTSRYAKILETELAKHDRKPEGEPFLLGYDPPFTIPFLRRNEVAVAVAADAP